MTTQKMLHNANKITYIATQYPQHKVSEVLALLQMPPIDVNTALWLAIELGWLSKPDPETERVEVLNKPDPWEFGTKVDELEAALRYAFEKLADKETDMEEFMLNRWTAGYASHDVLVAMRRLLEDNVLHEYVIEDGDSNYTFYTLYENREHLWGRKQFKKDPLEQPEKKQ